MKKWSASLASLFIAACAPTLPETSLTSAANLAVDVDSAYANLSAKSCANNIDRYDAPPLDLRVKAVQLGSQTAINEALPDNVRIAGAWHLTSPNPEFGGLSGLSLLPSGDLLSVSDRGYAVTLGFSGSNNISSGQASMMPLLNAKGKGLTGKSDGDAEGLAYDKGLAFISLERNHRVLAYDFGRCGSAAKGVHFAGLPKAKLGTRIAPNDGAEALDITPDGRISVGYETVINGTAPIITFDWDGIAREDTAFVAVEDAFKLVGADQGYHLFRAYDRELGNRNIISGPNVEFRLAPPLAVDNFEGIAVQHSEDGTVTQIFLISDDNFSNRQRTLLYLFEVTL